MGSSDVEIESELSPEAEEAFARYLQRRDADPALDFEAYCREHAAVAEELQRLHADWMWMEAWAEETDVAPVPDRAAYTVESELARGGMGTVFKIRDATLRRELAMKVCRLSEADVGSSPHARRVVHRFLQEAQITAQLDHPGVVPIHELATDAAGQLFFTMRLVEGRDLREVLALSRHGAEGWNRTRVLGVIVRICETLAYAHAKGVVHRDLKPSNIMVGRFGEAYVMDWGLAKVVGESEALVLTRHDHLSLPAVTSDRSEAIDSTPSSSLQTVAGAVVGTPAYMPPEQAEGHADELGPRADVYSMGAILYDLLAGGRPYGASAEVAEVLAAVRSGPPVPLGRCARDAPAELVAICDKAMARRPGERYAGMAELADELRAYLENRVVRAHRTGVLIELEKWVQRNKKVALTAAAGIVALLTLAVFVQVEARNRAAAEADSARFTRYLLDIHIADNALRSYDASAARQHLEACPEDLRDWEWTYLWNALDTSAATLPGDGTLVRELSFLPGEERVLVTRSSGATQVWDPATGQVGPAWPDEGERVVAGAGEWCLTRSTDAGWRLRNLENDDALPCAAVDGLRWTAVSPDGRYLAGARGASIEVRHPESGELVAELEGHTQPVTRATFRADGNLLASTSRDHSLRVWESSTGAELWNVVFAEFGQLHHSENPIAFIAGGTQVAIGLQDGSIRTYEAESGTPGDVFPGAWKFVTELDAPELEAILFSAGFDGSVRVWDLRRGLQRTAFLGLRSSIEALATDAEGRLIVASGKDGAVKLWRRAENREQGGPIPASSSIAVSPDGSAVVWSALGRIVMSDLSGETLWETRGQNRTSSLVFDPWSDRLYRAEGFGEILVLDARTGDILGRMQSGGTVPALVLSPDGDHLVSVDQRRLLQLWDTETLELEAECELDVISGSFTFQAFHPDGERFAVGNLDGEISVVRIPSLELERTIPAHDGSVNCVAYDDSGKLMLTAARDHRIHLWDAETGELLRTLLGHTDFVRCAAFHPEGTRIVSVGGDGKVKLWDVATGREVIDLAENGGYGMIARFSPDGDWLAIQSLYRGIRIWDLERGSYWPIAR